MAASTWIGAGFAALLWLTNGMAAADEAPRAAARATLISIVRDDMRATATLTGERDLSPAVAAALQAVPRHEFVPPAWRAEAYENRPLPIGHGQTISQPYIVAIMTQLLHLNPEARVLEIGTGSGYQAAVLAQLVQQVYSIEIIEALGRQAGQTLQRLGIKNVTTRIGDGYFGWSDAAPFDAIMVTAAASHVPPPLLQQLKPGGRMILPVSSFFFTQQLVLIDKAADGSVQTRQILPVAFVPLTGGH